MRYVGFKNRLAAAVLTAGILFSFSGCKASEKKDADKSGSKVTSGKIQKKNDSDKTDDPTGKTEPVTTQTEPPATTPIPTKSIDELKTIDGPMLTVSCEVVGPLNYYEDENRDSVYTLYYDGTLERISYHAESEPITSTVKIPDDAYLDFYLFCLEYGDGSAFAGYSEDVYDGEIFGFAYRDESGKDHRIYGGYCYQVKELMDIVHQVAGYFDPDYSIVCMNRIGGYEGRLETITNLSEPQIRRVNQLPDDVVLENGVDLDRVKYFYEYTYTTTEDAENGPIVCYVSANGYLVAMKNNRNWDVTDLLIEVNGKTLGAQWDEAAYNTYPLDQMLYEQGTITIEMDDWEFGKEGNVKDLKRNGPIKTIHCEPGMIIKCMTSSGDDILRIVTVEGEYECVPVAKINSVTQEELEEICGKGKVTVKLSLPEGKDG